MLFLSPSKSLRHIATLIKHYFLSAPSSANATLRNPGPKLREGLSRRKQCQGEKTSKASRCYGTTARSRRLSKIDPRWSIDSGPDTKCVHQASLVLSGWAKSFLHKCKQQWSKERKKKGTAIVPLISQWFKIFFSLDENYPFLYASSIEHASIGLCSGNAWHRRGVKVVHPLRPVKMGTNSFQYYFATKRSQHCVRRMMEPTDSKGENFCSI